MLTFINAAGTGTPRDRWDLDITKEQGADEDARVLLYAAYFFILHCSTSLSTVVPGLLTHTDISPAMMNNDSPRQVPDPL